MAEVQMPKLSDTMEEGTILQWLVADGEQVAKGQPFVEIETDKANMTVEAPEAGVLTRIAAEGDVLPVGAPIASIGGESRVAPPREEPAEAPADEDERTEIPVGDDGTAREIGLELGVGEDYVTAKAPADETPPAPPPEPARAAPSEDGGARVKASPLARRLARELGVDLARVRGSGPDGRVVRADVERASAGEEAALRPAPTPERPAAPPAAAPAAAAPAPAAPRPAGERTPLSRLQQTVARRMVQSAQEAPHFYLERDVDVTGALALRRQLVEGAPEDRRPSLNDLIVRAVGLAVAERPDAASRYDGDALLAPSGAHVGVAVAVERGLMVPVVRDADRKSVGAIAAEVRDLATRCRNGTITPAELEGSVISISNLGMFGVDRFSAVINPPEAAILAVGRAASRPVVRDGEVVVREMMTITLSVDHRALYGAEAATFLGRVAELLEHPGALVV